MRKFRAAPGLVFVVTLASTLTACGQEEPQGGGITGPTWQLVSLYATSDSPSELPDEVAGGARLVFGDTTIAGNTSCAPFQGIVDFNRDGQLVAARDATHVTITSIEFRDPAECIGGANYVDQQLRDMLTVDASFEIHQLNDDELLLRQDVGSVDQPALQLRAM